MNAGSVIVLVVTVGTSPVLAAPCELATPKACYERGVERFKANDAEAVGWFERACESGEAEGCTELGFLLMEGLLVARDDARSHTVSQRACELGSGLGCNNAFVMVRDARGTKRDDIELRRLAERSCTLTDGEGCFLAAAVLGEPIGGTLDQTRANAALDQSCKLGFAMGCSVIAHRHLEGSFGYAADEVKGVKMMGRACELGDGDGCDVVAAWTLAGERGLVRNVEKALGLFARACELEAEDGCKHQKALLEATATGTLAAKLVRRSSKRVLLSLGEGDAPPVAATGELSRKVTGAGVEMSLTIAKVTVKRVDGKTIELEVSEDLSTIEVDGKKVDHWKPGSAVTLSWKRAEPAPKP